MARASRFPRLGFLLGVAGLAIAGSPVRAAEPTKAVAAATDPSASQTYALGASDVIEVSVLGHPDYTTRQRVGEDGSIRLPFIGSVLVSEKTTGKLGDAIAAALEKGGYFANPIVKVDVVSYASRYVTVLGVVGSPGLVPVDRAYRLSEILARVGGVKDGGADYVVLRRQEGEERTIYVETLATGDDADDPFVKPGDKIYSPPAELFYVTGQVKAPGAYPLKRNLTFRMAIARGGGLTDSGNDHRINVTRGGKKLDSVKLDDPVRPGDVLMIPERLF